MSIPRQSWAQYVEQLGPSQTTRVEHDCGPGRVLRVSRSGPDYSAWCFRCNAGDSYRVQETVAETLQRLRSLQKADTALSGFQATLPSPAETNVAAWPPGAFLWLLRAGFSAAAVGRLGIFWHPESDRVVLPVFSGGRPVYWQARAYQPGRQPKYMGPTPKPPNLIAKWGDDAVPTLVEDILSAMKIGMVSEGWAVLGTSVSQAMLAALIRRGGKVNTWFDPDAGGKRAASKIVPQLRAFGIEVRNVVSQRDPKMHHCSDIKEILC